MFQKWEGDCDLWDLNEIIKKIYTESLKKIIVSSLVCVMHSTPPIAELLCVKNGRAIVVCGILMK